MPTRTSEIANLAFADLIERGEVAITSETGECHVMADDWTLVLVDDPLSDVMIALDDEEGDPEGLLRDLVTEDELAAMRQVDGELAGQVSQLLGSSPDGLANALARMLAN